MGVSKILLSDKDREYAKALATALSTQQNEFEITIISLETLKNRKVDTMIPIHEYNLILLGGYPEEIVESISRKLKKRNCIVILSDDIVKSLTEQFENEADHFRYIYKYSNLNDIISDLNYLAGSVAGKKSLARKSSSPELIGFYSMGGGSGKTVLAFGLSRELSRFHDKKVLYLSFEEMPATELFVGNHTQNRNISDYLYYLFEKKNAAQCSRPAGFITADPYGVETFYPSNGRNDMSYLNQLELIHFLKTLSESSRYDYIIMDLKNDLAEDTLFLTKQCSKIIFVQTDDPVSALKTRKMIAYLEKTGFTEIWDRAILAVNRISGAEKEECSDRIYSCMKQFYIEQDDDSFRYASGHLDIDINHAFGVGIKKIADELLLQKREGEKSQCTENSVR